MTTTERTLNRSCWFEFPDADAAVKAIATLRTDSPTQFVVNDLFPRDDGTVEVFFTLKVGDLVDGHHVINDHGIRVWVPMEYAGEYDFHRVAKACGGDYTGS